MRLYIFVFVGRDFVSLVASVHGADPIAGNVRVYAVRGIGGLKNEAQRNVKPDLPQLSRVTGLN
jgi:hypothetical protein